MVRGGSRAKAGGASFSGDYTSTSKLWVNNLTFIQFLQTCYLEKDLVSYCANRLSEYSCIYRLDPTVPAMSVNAWSTGATPIPASNLSKYPQHFFDQTEAPKISTPKVTQTIAYGDPIKGTFLGPVNLKKMIPTDDGIQLAVIESHRLPLNAVSQVLVPIFLLITICVNLLMVKYTYNMAHRQLCIINYLFYIATIDTVDSMAHFIDFMIEAYSGVRLFLTLQFFTRSACQILPMVYSLMKHIHAGLFIALSFDVYRFSQSPYQVFKRFQLEWTKNALILVTSLAIIVNSQFIWSFDLVEIETKYLHNRFVRNAYECGYTEDSSFNSAFLFYIWPLFDHLQVELIPLVSCLACGGISLWRLSRSRHQNEDGIKSVNGPVRMSESELETVRSSGRELGSENPGTLPSSVLLQCLRTLSIILVVNGAFIVPRTLYYLVKYVLFAGHVNRVGTDPGIINSSLVHKALRPLAQQVIMIGQLRQYEVKLEAVEMVLRYLGSICIIIRALIFIRSISQVKRQFVSSISTIRRKLNVNIHTRNLSKSLNSTSFFHRNKSTQEHLIPLSGSKQRLMTSRSSGDATATVRTESMKKSKTSRLDRNVLAEGSCNRSGECTHDFRTRGNEQNTILLGEEKTFSHRIYSL